MSNPLLNRSFDREGILDGETMTVSGAVLKSLILLITIILSAGYTWHLAISGYTDKMSLLTSVGFIVAMIAGLVTVLARPAITPILSLIYAVGEGLFLGGISIAFESVSKGIVVNAVMSTFIVLGVMLFLYATRIIRLSENLKCFITTATLSILLIYLIQIGAGFFGRSIPLIFSSGTVGIGFSLFVIAVAAINFIPDFAIIEEGSKNGFPKMYEWIGAIGLMFTLVWLYMEFLRLFLKRN